MRHRDRGIIGEATVEFIGQFRADIGLIFDVPPEARYDAAMQALGVNTANLSEEAGHA